MFLLMILLLFMLGACNTPGKNKDDIRLATEVALISTSIHSTVQAEWTETPLPTEVPTETPTVTPTAELFFDPTATPEVPEEPELIVVPESTAAPEADATSGSRGCSCQR